MAMYNSYIVIIMSFALVGYGIYLGSSYSTSYRETTPVHMSDVQCSGTESRLTDCPHTPGGSGSGVSLECGYYSSGS